MNPVHARQLAFVLVLSAHVAALYLLSHSLRPRKIPTRPQPIAFTALLIERHEESEPVDQHPDPVPRDLRRPRRTSPSSQVPPPESPRGPPPSSTAITDWYSQAEISAEGVLERERARGGLRSFTHESSPTPDDADPPGIFGSERRNRRAGTVDGEQYWVTDNCYYEYDRAPRPIPQAGDAVRLKKRTCKPPPTGGGEHMFDSLKPEYLKRLPEPRFEE